MANRIQLDIEEYPIMDHFHCAWIDKRFQNPLIAVGVLLRFGSRGDLQQRLQPEYPGYHNNVWLKRD